MITFQNVHLLQENLNDKSFNELKYSLSSFKLLFTKNFKMTSKNNT